jgi:hypothetical protein
VVTSVSLSRFSVLSRVSSGIRKIVPSSLPSSRRNLAVRGDEAERFGFGRVLRRLPVDLHPHRHDAGAVVAELGDVPPTILWSRQRRGAAHHPLDDVTGDAGVEERVQHAERGRPRRGERPCLNNTTSPSGSTTAEWHRYGASGPE